MTDAASDRTALPLAGIKVVEFTHMVMGPTTGMVLADLGAEVIKIEPKGGDNTRRLVGSGAGYFPMYSRNKRSLALDLKHPEGKAVAEALVGQADVVIENFRPGVMDALGFGYETLSKTNPRLIYCSDKGFLNGPYGERTALDEIAQMMGGLAYMTGPPERPLRAGASVIDVMGGLFGVIGVLAALEQRHATGRGQLIQSALFENCVFLVGQHMAQYAVTGQAARPMPVRISAWAIYDQFETKSGERVFVGVVSDGQWQTFCKAFGFDDLGADPGLVKNNDRVAARDRILPRVQALFATMDKDELLAKLETTGLPFAPIVKPEELFDDPHLNASGGLVPLTLPDSGKVVNLPALPIEMAGRRFGVRHDLPRPGENSRAILAEAGYDAAAIESLLQTGVVLDGAEA